MNKNWLAQICSGMYSGGRDTCQGDSGGALYAKDTTGIKTHLIVAGITSYGFGCGRRYYPG